PPSRPHLGRRRSRKCVARRRVQDPRSLPLLGKTERSRPRRRSLRRLACSDLEGGRMARRQAATTPLGDRMLSRRTLLAASAAQLPLLGACASPSAATHVDATTPDTPAPVPPPTPDQQFSMLLDRISTDILKQSPERCTSLGVTEQRAGGRYIDKL